MKKLIILFVVVIVLTGCRPVKIYYDIKPDWTDSLEGFKIELKWEKY